MYRGLKDNKRSTPTKRIQFSGLLAKSRFRPLVKPKRWASLLGAFSIMVAASLLLTIQPQKVLAVPGVPAAPGVIYTEDFENSMATTYRMLDTYVGTPPQNETYTAAPIWISETNCNGIVTSFNTLSAGGCSTPLLDAYVRPQAQAIGNYNGVAAPNDNHVLSGVTNGTSTPGGLVQFETVQPIPLATPGRFIAFAVDIAANTCNGVHPLLRFYLMDGATEVPLNAANIDGCTGAGDPSKPPVTYGATRAGRYLADTPILFSGSQFGIRLRNFAPAASGNDAAIDNIRVLDVTPAFDKSFGPNPSSIGSASTLTFTLTNTSELLAKTDLTFTDNLSTGLVVASPNDITSNCGNAVVTGAPGATSVAITGADLAAGQTSCTITIKVAAANGGAATFSNGPANMTNMAGLVPPTSSTDMTFGVPAIRTVKTVSPSTGVVAGTQLNYTITTTNIGQVPIANATVADPHLASLNCSPAQGSPLAIGASMTCTGTYTATQADVNAGSIANTANGCGTPTGSPQICDDDTQTITIARTPQLSLTKNVTGFNDNDGSSAISTGDVVHYSLVATNSGNTTITGATVTDNRISALSCTPAVPVSSLAPGASITCTGDVTATGSDQTAGNVVNTATCSGTPPAGTTLPACTATSTQPMVAAAPEVQILKATPVNNDADSSNSITAGDTLAYTLTLRNSGTQALTAVTASDPMLTGLTCGPTTSAGQAFANGTGSLPINTTVTCTGQHIVTQAEQNSGSIANTASVTAQSAGGPVTDTDVRTVQAAVAAPSLAVTKTASQTTGLRLGDVVTYTIVATNNGNVTLDSVVVTDPALSALVCTPAAPANLNPGQSTQCTGQYTITQADMNAGEVSNQAKACNTSTSLCADSNEIAIQLTQAIHATNTKTTATPRFTDTDGSGAPSAGDVLHYNLKLINDGNVTLSNVSVADTPALANFTCTPTIPVASLAPGASITCTGDHTITTGEQTAGTADDTMTSTATDPDGNAVTIAPATLSEPVTPPAEALNLDKTVLSSTDPDTSGDISEGDVVTYRIVASNNGNVALSGATVSDPSLTGLSCTPAIPTTLAAGSSITCTGNYTITLADMNTGEHLNTATASGTSPGGTVVNGTDSQTITLDQESDIATAKSLVDYDDNDTSGNITPGDELNYQITTSNIGNVTLDNVIVSDSLVTSLACTPSIPASLDPGQSITCTGSYTATQGDQDTGEVVNTVEASGIDPNAVTRDATDTETQATAGQAPDASITKVIQDFTSDTRFSEGDEVPYDITYTNTGNVTLGAVSVSDALIADLVCDRTAPVALAPGETITCSGDGPTLTRADVETGFIENTALAQGTSQTASFARQAAQTALVIDPKVAVSLAKTSDIQDINGNAAADPGETILYTVKATNTGNVAIFGANVSDSKLPNLSCDDDNPGLLSIGKTVTCTGSYVVTKADFTNKTVVNTALVAGEDAWGNAAADQAIVTDPTVGSGDLANTGASMPTIIATALLIIAGAVYTLKRTAKRI